MNKKIMLLGLAVVSTVLFALPGIASAQEAHIEGITTFSGTGGASTLVASGEPTITCESVEAHPGEFSSGGTTGTVSLRFKGCHATVFFTLKCKTTFSTLDNAIEMSGTLHVITVNNKPGVLMTPAVTEIICAGISNTIVAGLGVIGTITSPACGVSSNELKISFSALGEAQNHQTYTAFTEVHLTTKTSGGSALPAGFTSTITLSSFVSGKLNCT